MNCELVISGWYSSSDERSYQTFGSDTIRRPSFRGLWEWSIAKALDPQNVYITDSDSPNAVPESRFLSSHVQINKLLRNPGHSQNCTTEYCGASAAILSGLEYALHSGVEIVVYVEQDALIFGDNFWPVIRDLTQKHGIVFSGQAGKEIEHTVMAFHKRSIRPFLTGIHSMTIPDRMMQPEFKFMLSASGAARLPNSIKDLASYRTPRIMRRLFYRALRIAAYYSRSYEVLPFGFGRARPIDFSSPCLYFQQGTDSELAAFARLSEFPDVAR